MDHHDARNGENTMSDTAGPMGAVRRAATALVTFGVIVAGGGTAYGVLGLNATPTAPERDRVRVGPVEPLTVDPGTETPTPEPTPTPTAEPEPEPVLAPGDAGREVRELQARLAQLDWFAPMTTGTYGPGTRAAVSGFQDKRGLEATGVVDRRTWRRLTRMSATPTQA